MNFVIIANQWDVHKDNPTSKHHVAMELLCAGHKVLWVVGTGMRTPSVGSGADRGRILRKILCALAGVRKESGPWSVVRGQAAAGSMFIIAPLVIPVPVSAIVRRVNERIYLWVIGRAAGKLGFENPVLINFLPTIPGVHDGWKGKSVYYCVDRWSAFAEYDSELMDRLDAECCRNADMVIASARDLEQRCLAHNKNTHLVLHGVDHAHFAKYASRSCLGGVLGRRRITDHVSRPSDLPEGRLVGFFGHIGSWLDQELLIKLARELNQTTDYGLRTTEESSVTNIIMLGRSDVDVSRLEKEPNIYLLGQKNYSELPDYLAHFDVGIIPFVINDLTKALNPIKLREMLAGGVRVVSTALPEVEQLQKTDKGVWVAGDADEFVGMVENCLESPLSEDEKKALSESMVGETWEVKVGEILKRIQLIVGLMESKKQKVTKGAKRRWVCGGILLLLIVLMWPVGTGLQCRNLHVGDSDVDAVYLVAGAKHQNRRIEALTQYLKAGADIGAIRFLVGRDDQKGRWNRESQKNLNMHEWAVFEIRKACANRGVENVNVTIVPGSFTGTDGEMEVLAQYLDGYPELTNLAIVTSPFHIRRVLWRLKHYMERGIVVSVISPESRYLDRAPWIVALELGKMLRDLMGLSRAPMLSRS